MVGVWPGQALATVGRQGATPTTFPRWFVLATGLQARRAILEQLVAQAVTKMKAKERQHKVMPGAGFPMGVRGSRGQTKKNTSPAQSQSGRRIKTSHQTESTRTEKKRSHRKRRHFMPNPYPASSTKTKSTLQHFILRFCRKSITGPAFFTHNSFGHIWLGSFWQICRLFPNSFSWKRFRSKLPSYKEGTRNRQENEKK